MNPPSRPPGGTGRNTVDGLRLLEKLRPALQRRDRAAAVDIVRQLVQLRAPLAGQWVQLAQIAAANGENTLAREAMGLHLQSAGADPVARFSEVGLLAFLNAWEEVLALLRILPPEQPDPVSYAYIRGTAALYLGERDEALHYLQQAIRLQPLSGSPWLSLSVLVDFAREPELAEQVIAAAPFMERASRGELGNYSYALGKALAQRGEHAQAFAAYSRGAQLLKGQLPYSRDQDLLSARESVGGYDRAQIAEFAQRQSEPTGRGIFVMGLPRSGTTLVEQILTSHSAVGDGAETYRLNLLAGEVGGPSSPAVQRYVDAGKAPEAAQLWRHWLAERFPAEGRVVDKSLNTSRLLGLAASLLPEAPLIWLVRDPLDCAWSCFRTRFSAEAPWSYDLEDIAFHFRLESQLLEQWRTVLGARLLVVPYEGLVTDPRAWIPLILAHCGLDEEPQVFSPHENPRAVTTSSAMQVRQPINRDGIGSAEPYREFLAPFVRAFYP